MTQCSETCLLILHYWRGDTRCFLARYGLFDGFVNVCLPLCDPHLTCTNSPGTMAPRRRGAGTWVWEILIDGAFRWGLPRRRASPIHTFRSHQRPLAETTPQCLFRRGCALAIRLVHSVPSTTVDNSIAPGISRDFTCADSGKGNSSSESSNKASNPILANLNTAILWLLLAKFTCAQRPSAA